MEVINIMHCAHVVITYVFKFKMLAIVCSNYVHLYRQVLFCHRSCIRNKYHKILTATYNCVMHKLVATYVHT